MDNSNDYDLDPSPCILILRIMLFSHKKVSLMVIVHIKVYKRKFLTMWPVCKYLYHIYIYIYINVYVYVCAYVYM